MFKTKALVLAKNEAVYGTDPAPTTALNAILSDLPEIEFVYKKLDRLNVKAFLGNRPAINLGEALKISFSTEIRGQGATAVIPPELGVLLVGCGMAETVGASDVTYTPQDDLDGPSITIYFYQHDLLHHLHGCRGTWSLEGKAGEFGKFKWEFTGLYAGPVDGALPTDAVFNDTLPPALKSASFSLGGYAGTIENFKMTYGNELAKRSDVNAPTGFLSQFIKDRKVTAEIDPEAEALTAFNPVSLLTNGAEQTLSITFGSASANRLVISCPRVVLDGVKYAEREGILTYSLPLLVCPDAGADDVSLAFT